MLLFIYIILFYTHIYHFLYFQPFRFQIADFANDSD